MLTTPEPWQKAWLTSRNRPIRFVTEVLGATPEPWQAEALRALEQRDRIAIRSGHGVGKTSLLSWLVLWFLLTHKGCKVPVVANSQDQLRDTIWPEIGRWRRRLPPPLQDAIEVTSEKIFIKVAPEEAFAVSRTASKDNPEALQGFHADHILFLLDEASGIPDSTFNVAQGALSTAGAKVVMTGNPTRNSGYFYDAFHRLRERWYTMRVSSADVPRARGHIDDVIAKSGKDSNEYRIRVAGEFPTTEDEQIIPLELIEAAIARDVAPAHRATVWGLDVARFGDDRSALAKRRGNVLLEKIKAWSSRDLMQTCGIVVKEWSETPEGDRPASINVDVIGLGAGVCDRLRELGLPARGVNVGEAPHGDPARFMRLRDELWFKARDWFAARDCHMPDDPGLIGELTGPSYGFSSTGKIQVESKVSMKKRGRKSPDLADAFCLTFGGGDLALAVRRLVAAQEYDPFGYSADDYQRQQQASAGSDWDPFR